MMQVECTPLHAAVNCGKKDIVSLLLNRGANVEATDEVKGSEINHIYDSIPIDKAERSVTV
jgi:ankyrin repeat protein